MDEAASSKWSPPGKFYILLATLVLLSILFPLAPDLRVFLLVSDLLLGAVLLAIVYAVSGSPRMRLLAGLLTVVSLILIYLVRSVSDDWILPAHISVLLLLALASVVILLDVLHDEQVTGDKIAGAISFYLLLGLAWGILYSLIHWSDPTAFPSLSHEVRATFRGDNMNRFFYFSFSTLTTLGYGDIVPASRMARSLAALEALVGQVYLAVLVARLVGLHIVHSQRPKNP